MSVRELVRPLPGVRQISLLRQHLAFRGSARFWEENYARGDTSGDGSYGPAALAKAEFLNDFVRRNAVESVVEFGCGDGNQLSLAEYPRYTGLDVSRTAIGLCQGRFAADQAKSFFLYDGGCFTDHTGIFAADLALSLDVIYHLIEDEVFDTYMRHLFAAGRRFVVVYSTNSQTADAAPQVRHRVFTDWVERHRPDWELTEVTEGPNVELAGRADFFAYQRSAD